MAITEQAYLPITELSAYQQKWIIKARVTTKAPLRNFNTRAGTPGRVFSVDLLDAEGGEIRASIFNQAAEKFYDKLEVGKCYTFSKGSIRVANRQFNNCNHRYELSFDRDGLIELASDDGKIDAVKFSISSLHAVQSKVAPCNVDLCGIIVSFAPVVSRTKDGQELTKRDITVADDSALSMVVTLWGERARQSDRVFEGNPVVGLKGVMVKDWNGGRSGSLTQGGKLVFDPELPDAKRVKQWWAQGGSGQTLAHLSQTNGGGDGRAANAKPTTMGGLLRTAAELVTEQPELFNIVGRLALVQLRKQGEVQPLSYMACQEPKEGTGWPCNRRVDTSGFCATCGRNGKVAPRLNIRCRFVDFEDQSWMTTFHEAAQRVLGMTAEEVNQREQEESGREQLEAAIRQRYFVEPVSMTARAKLDSYNGETRANITVVDAHPVNRGDHGRQMLKEINDMLAMESK